MSTCVFVSDCNGKFAIGLLVHDDCVCLLAQIVPLIQVRMTTLDEAPQLAGFFFDEYVDPPPEDLIAKKLTAAQSRDAAAQAYSLLEGLPNIKPTTVEQPMRDLAEKLKLKPGQLFGILRSAATGQKISPPLFESMEIIGRDKVFFRISEAIAKLEKLASNEN